MKTAVMVMNKTADAPQNIILNSHNWFTKSDDGSVKEGDRVEASTIEGNKTIKEYKNIAENLFMFNIFMGIRLILTQDQMVTNKIMDHRAIAAARYLFYSHSLPGLYKH